VAGQIEQSLAKFAHISNRGVIVTDSALALVQRALIINLMSRYRLLAVYPSRVYVSDGGLMSFGLDRFEQFQQAADYVDRILKGEHPANLPVQFATRFELAINLKTAKALGVSFPPNLVVSANEVIE
jgi:putative ABC transport system substrate-binding protein